MKKGLVSIVLPIYNVEKYLNRCMESVVNQTYSNIEIIMVDDGSTDSSGKICEEWKMQDNRIRVVHKNNEGLGLARNTGIENAEGEYVCFFDSDDYIEFDTVEKLYSAAKANNSDIVTFGFRTINSDGKMVNETVPSIEKTTFEGEEIIEFFLPEMISFNPHTGISSGLWMSAWASMYSMELIKKYNWKFVSERIMISEDVYSLLILYKHVSRVTVVRRAFYYYCENDTSSLTRVFRADRYQKQKTFLKGCLAVCDDLNYSEEIRMRLCYQFIGNSLGAMKRIAISEAPLNKRYDQISTIVNDDIMQNVISKLELRNESKIRKLLFSSIKNKLSIVTFILVLLQAKRTL